MKTKVFLLLALSIVMVSTGANAAMLDADCDGWTSSGSFTMPTDLEFTIYLYQDGELIWSYTETANVTYDDPYFLFTGEWPMELCGDYTVHLDLNYNMGVGWRTLSYDTEFTCECDEPGYCTFTPGYWKNHEEAWPVMNLTVGCVDYTQAELLEIFDWPTKGGNVAIKLFHHLVAAKLNVLGGSDDYIAGAIMDADDYFCMYPLTRLGYGDNGRTGDLKEPLVTYNEIECEEEEDDDEMLAIEGPAAMENSAATETSSWGSIKKKLN